MALTVDGRRLTEAHRLAQVQVKAVTVALTLRLAPLLASDPARWTALMLSLMVPLRVRSAALSAEYMTQFRTVEVGEAIQVDRAQALPMRAVASSLAVTGPARLRQVLARDVPMSQALRLASASAAASASRHVLNGGRETVIGAVQGDDVARGWYRATDGNPCAFCAMLASRGATYRSEESGGFQPHDGCGCVPEPVYGPGRPPGRTNDFKALWNEATPGTSGEESLRAFRRAYEKSRPRGSG